MPNDSYVAFFLENWGCCGSAWGQNEDFEMLVVVIVLFEIKITLFTCLPSSEGCNSFPKHLDLTLAPNKTNEGGEKQ